MKISDISTERLESFRDDNFYLGKGERSALVDAELDRRRQAKVEGQEVRYLHSKDWCEYRKLQASNGWWVVEQIIHGELTPQHRIWEGSFADWNEITAAEYAEAKAKAGKVEPERVDLLDWAESLLCNAKPMSHCTQEDWDKAVLKWRDEKHGRSKPAPEVKTDYEWAEEERIKAVQRYERAEAQVDSALECLDAYKKALAVEGGKMVKGKIVWTPKENIRNAVEMPIVQSAPEVKAIEPTSPCEPIDALPSVFQKELEQLINRHSMENGSDTPDYILADYIMGCLSAWKVAVRARDKWYSYTPWAKESGEV